MFIQDLPVAIKERRICEIFDDFVQYTDAQLWTKLVTGAGATVANSSTLVGGVVVLTTGATLNNEAAVATTNKVFTPGKNQPLHFECVFQYTDAHTHDLGFACGLADNIGTTGFITAAGAGLVSSWSGFVIYKQLGDTLWRVGSSITTTLTTNQSTSAVDDGASSGQHVFRIDVHPVDGTNVEVTFWYDGAQMVDNSSKLPIKHVIAYASFANLKAGAFAKASTANSQVVNVDYISAYQLSRQTLA